MKKKKNKKNMHKILLIILFTSLGASFGYFVIKENIAAWMMGLVGFLLGIVISLFYDEMNYSKNKKEYHPNKKKSIARIITPKLKIYIKQ